MDSFMLLKERAGDLHLYHALSVRSSSLLTNPTQLSQKLCQADEAFSLAGYAVFTFFLRWVYNFEDVAARLMKSFGVGTDGILIPKIGFIDSLGERALPKTVRDASAQIFSASSMFRCCSDEHTSKWAARDTRPRLQDQISKCTVVARLQYQKLLPWSATWSLPLSSIAHNLDFGYFVTMLKNISDQQGEPMGSWAGWGAGEVVWRPPPAPVPCSLRFQCSIIRRAGVFLPVSISSIRMWDLLIRVIRSPRLSGH